MKFSKKILFVVSLGLLLAGLAASTAFAGGTRVVRLAQVSDLKVLDDQPATFRLVGSYTCDKVQVNASVSGKVVTLYVYDVRNLGTPTGCDNTSRFSKTISAGVLVPGVYTVLVNPDAYGRPQKKLRSLVAPLIPPTPTAPPAQP